ncbi:MAG: class I SAM-dependent rRNA methyltransferase [Pseudomonadota bacterium]
MSQARLILKPGREKSLRRFHPWIFSGAVAELQGEVPAGGTVAVLDHKGHCHGYAAWSPASQIRGRMWSFDPDESIDAAFFRRRIERALDYRRSQGVAHSGNAERLVASEADALPGLIVDRYADTLVCQILSSGCEYWRDTLVEALRGLFPDHRIVERSDVAVRQKEGLEPRKGVLHEPSGADFDGEVVIEENGYRLGVDVLTGHKTGFYLDQRVNRARVARYARDLSVLNCFAYTGGFSVACLQAGARKVINIDESQPALDRATLNLELNDLDTARQENRRDDVFKALRQYRDRGEQFDMIILDPPKFADNKGQVNRACRGYKDINLCAMKLLKPGGLLATFSCSGLISADLFQKTVADAAQDAGRNARIVERLHQSPDHPTALAFPESYYLKGLVLKVD